jgi:CheY-like chemotaxis protein
MNTTLKTINILMADDDEEDCLFAKKAFDKSTIPTSISFVHDGEELIDYLKNQGNFKDKSTTVRPDLILLDLNMPRKDGREALAEIKSDPDLHNILVIILTTSKQEEDIHNTYELGANSFICKPVDFEGMVKAIHTLIDYWFNIVQIPR